MNYKAEALRLAGSRFEIFRNWVETASYNEVVRELGYRDQSGSFLSADDVEAYMLRCRLIRVIEEDDRLLEP